MHRTLRNPLWLKLPSRLKILVTHGTSVPSTHLDQDPVTSCLDLTFSLSPTFPPLSHSYSFSLGPACHCGWSRLIPPSPSFISFIFLIHYIFTRSCTQFSDFHTYLPLSSPLSRPGLSLWQVPLFTLQLHFT